MGNKDASNEKESKEVIFDHINGIRIDDKTNPYSQRAMYKIEIWMDTTDSKICEQAREWMLVTMNGGRKPLRPFRTHWKSFSHMVQGQVKDDDDDKSEATSATVASSSS